MKKPKKKRSDIEALRHAVKKPKGLKVPRTKVTVRRGFSRG
jgi:hypothetical protein